MSKRRSSKSEKSAPSEGHDAKRRKDKDTRDKDLAAEDSLWDSKATSNATPNTSSTSKASTRGSTLRASTLSNSKVSSSTTKALPKTNFKNLSKKASSSKSSSLKPSKKDSGMNKGNSNASGVTSGSKSSSKSSTSQKKKYHKLKKSKDSKDTYMSTLNGIAPPKEGPSESKDIFLNEEETNVDLGDAIELFDSDEERKKNVPQSDNDAELLSDGDSSGGDMDVGSDLDDNMNVRDVSKPTKPTKHAKDSESKKSSTKKTKILESYFEDVELAHLGKSSVRMAICIKDMWPKEEEPDLDLLKEELGKMGNEEQLLSLKKISSDPVEVKVFRRFINYGTSAVRSDIGTIVRILVAQFFKLSVSKGEKAQEESDRVKWLLAQKKYHQDLDFKTRTITGGPFSSPLIGMILRAYFVDSPSQQDVFLIKRMKKTRKMGHSIREWYGGVKVKIHLTRPNNEAMLHSSDKDRYHSLCTTMRRTKKNAKTYTENLQIDLFQEMSSDDVNDDDIPNYDYEALEAAAKAKRKERESLKASHDYSENEDESGSGGSRSHSRSGSGSVSGSGSGSGNESDKRSDTGTVKGRRTNNDRGTDNDSENDVGKGSKSKNRVDTDEGDEDVASSKDKGKGVVGRGD
ncbi:hypothetical protein C8R42DRAFT_648591 [Lentinula raphanica]|nr:hypothetical protein C8R42DRAFT_648591 [Lentinula raphanica]